MKTATATKVVSRLTPILIATLALAALPDLARASTTVLAQGAGYPNGSPQVALLQQRLRLVGEDPGPVDGRFGPQTEAAVIRYQRRDGLAVDGLAGPSTQTALRRALKLVGRGAGYGSPQGSGRVRRLQRALKRVGADPGPIDGRFGPATEAALVGFQRRQRLAADGVAGDATLRALERRLKADDADAQSRTAAGKAKPQGEAAPTAKPKAGGQAGAPATAKPEGQAAPAAAPKPEGQTAAPTKAKPAGQAAPAAKPKPEGGRPAAKAKPTPEAAPAATPVPKSQPAGQAAPAATPVPKSQPAGRAAPAAGKAKPEGQSAPPAQAKPDGPAAAPDNSRAGGGSVSLGAVILLLVVIVLASAGVLGLPEKLVSRRAARARPALAAPLPDDELDDELDERPVVDASRRPRRPKPPAQRARVGQRPAAERGGSKM